MPTPNPTQNTSDSALQTAYTQARRLLRRSDVTGVSIGEALRKGKPRGLAICIYVAQKLPRKALTKAQRLPKSIAGIPVDILERRHVVHVLPLGERQARRLNSADPVPPGVEVGPHNGGTGTLGLVVVDALSSTRDICILTAAHVLNVPTGTAVYQPRIETPQNLLGHVRRKVLNKRCDAAIAVVDSNRQTTNLPMGCETPINGCRDVQMGDILCKSGSMTGVTQAVVKSIGLFKIDYPGYGEKLMEGFELCPLAGTDEISDEGDSGSVWYDPISGEGVGLSIAGDKLGEADINEWAFACHLSAVIQEMNVDFP